MLSEPREGTFVQSSGGSGGGQWVHDTSVDRSALVHGPAGPGRHGPRREGRTRPDQDGWRLAAFHAKSGTDVRTDHWEVCPESDKLVSCLIGMIRLCLRPEPGAAEEEVRLTAGTAAVVPRGRWHRIKLDVPSTIITVALPRGTLLEERTEGASPVLFSAGT